MHELGACNVKVYDKSWVPLRMVMSPTLIGYEDILLKAVREAESYWNEKSGLPLFTGSDKVSITGHSVLLAPAPYDIRNGARTVAYTCCKTDVRGALTGATIYLNSNWILCSHRELIQIMTHELGHCLGLRHDGTHGSVMYGNRLNGVYTITDASVKFLRQVYGER